MAKDEDVRKVTLREASHVLNVKRSSIWDDIRLSLIDDGVGLEKLWPGCTVYWDFHPNWVNHYLRLKIHREYPTRDSLDEEVTLVAFKLNESGHLELIQSSNKILKSMYVGSPVRAEYVDEHWIVIR